LEPGALEEILAGLPQFEDPDILVGTGVPDDAGVYRLRPDLALVQTVDFFTPVLDDPYQFGQVAAANAISDIYAMGATPLTALNLVGFPICSLGTGVLREILRGGCDKVAEAGAVMLGGHSIEDDEPKYGLAVTGVVHPEQLVTNSNAQAGDCLVLTKPLGTGVLVSALKGELLSPAEEKELAEVMAALNGPAAEAMLLVGINACTDITGFGLLGHLREMALNSGVDVQLDVASLPLLPRAKEFAAEGLVPAGAYRNREHFADHVKIIGSVPPEVEDLLYDPQTSGGLLIAVPEENCDKLLSALNRKGVVIHRVIGRVVEKGSGKISVQGV
jgi:selenide,water dikinase